MTATFSVIQGAIRSRTYLLLMILVVGVYARSVDDPFHFDDHHAIVDNDNLRGLHNVPRFFVDPGSFSVDAALAMYRPLLLTTFAVNHAISGASAWSYHVGNVLIHGGVAIAAFEVLLLLTANLRLACLGAALFAAHPVHSEAVYYVSSRSESLATLFVLVALALHLAPARPSTAVLRTAAFAAGLLSKSTAIALLPMALLHDILLRPGDWRRRWRDHASMASVAALYLFFTRDLIARATVAAPVRSYDEQLWSQVKALVVYLHLLIVPRGLSVDHEFQLSASLADPYAAAALLVLVSIFGVMLACRRLQPLTLFLALWFVIALAPASVVPLNVIVNEHRLYLSGVAVAAGIALLPRSSGLSRGALWLVVAVFALLSFQRGQAWDSSQALWQDAVHKGPHMARPRLQLGQQLARSGHHQEATTMLEAALLLDPGFAPGYRMLAESYLALHRVDSAWGTAERATQACADDADVWALLAEVARARALTDGGPARQHWFERSATAYRRALELSPVRSAYHDNLGNTYQMLRQPKRALVHHQRAVELNPASAESRLNLGNALLLLGRLADAAAAFEQAVRADARYVPAWQSLSSLYAQLGDSVASRAAYHRALALGGGERDQ